MSTRGWPDLSCCVEILTSNGNPEVQLYHHWDGYPSNMVPLLKEAFNKFKTCRDERAIKFKTLYQNKPDYEIRPHKLVNYLVMVDPEGYEIEYADNPASDTKLFFPQHGDLEYFYSIQAKGLDWHLTVKASYSNEIIYKGPLDKCGSDIKKKEE